jgi:prolyl 4-hydroxylase
MPYFVKGLAPDIFTIPELLDPDECQWLIERGEAMGFEKATVNLSSGPTMMPEYRNNDRVIWDDPRYAAELWERIKSLIPEGPEGQPTVGLNERWRFYRYEPGQQFKRHRDGTLAIPPRTVQGVALPLGRSLTTLMIYLSDSCEGGETAFFTERGNEFLRVRPETGTALCFAHQILHEGCTVTAGQKYVLRTDIMYKP